MRASQAHFTSKLFLVKSSRVPAVPLFASRTVTRCCPCC
jgi:hypothetical protein